MPTASLIDERYSGHRYEFLDGGRLCCSADHLGDLCEECQQKAVASTPSPARVASSGVKALRAAAARITTEGRIGPLRTAAEWDRHFAGTLGFNAIFDRAELPAPDGYAEALTNPTPKPVGYRQAEDTAFDSFGNNPPDPYAIALKTSRGTK